MGDSDALDGRLSHYAHETCAEVSVAGVKWTPEYDPVDQHWSTVYDDAKGSELLVGEPSPFSDDGFWDPTAFAADIARLSGFGESSFALSDSTLEPNASIPSQVNGEVKGKRSHDKNCKTAQTSGGKRVLRKSWTRAEEELFEKALEVFGPPDVHTDPASGRVSVRLSPV